MSIADTSNQICSATSMNSEIEKEFIKAYDDFSDAIFRHCFFRTFDRELAKDLVQETFSRVWEYIVKGGEIENMRPFLYKTAGNLIIDHSRKNKELSLEELNEQGFDPKFNEDIEEKAIIKAEVKYMIKIMGKLDKEDREIVVMRFIDELSPREIGEITGLSENAVSVRIHRALKKIRGIIQNI